MSDRFYAQRRAEFVSTNLRVPNVEEDRQVREQARADQRADEATRHEAEVKRAFMAQPGATLESWERERADILRKDREQKTIAAQRAARAESAQRYRF